FHATPRALNCRSEFPEVYLTRDRLKCPAFYISTQEVCKFGAPHAGQSGARVSCSHDRPALRNFRSKSRGASETENDKRTIREFLQSRQKRKRNRCTKQPQWQWLPSSEHVGLPL